MPAPTPKAMTDKEYIEDVLLTSKTLTSMYHYATQESSTEGLHNQFKCNLNDSLAMQHRIFAAMQQSGWYPQQQAEQQQINQVKMKYGQ
ncbi:MAG: spore coat protein [Oscillospiraceae bacterium]|nr:spore coat protein [Oscillospiraceae bacterium]